MATKSDFAQKLLHDLRARKERMATAAAQSSSRPSTQTSRAVQGNMASRGSRHTNALEPPSSRRGSTSRGPKNGTHTPRVTNKASNQIVLYNNGGQKASGRQIGDLSMAIALAFESGGNLTSIRASAANPLVKFFNRFNRKSRGITTHEMDLTTLGNNNRSRIPIISNIHVSQVSRGVQRLNSILRACSNGFGLEDGSIEIGKELLKGAIDLEESLRMLVDLQEASQYAENARNKGRFKLLEEDEDEKDDDSKIAKKWELDRPKFSFDRPRRREVDLLGLDEASEKSIGDLNLVRHQRSASYVRNSGFFTQVNQTQSSISSQSTQERKRISNVVAKLMGLDETPHYENFVHQKSDKQTIAKLVEPLSLESNNPQKGRQLNEHHQISGNNPRKQNPTTESEKKKQILKTEMQQKAQNSNMKKEERRESNKIEHDSGKTSTEMRTQKEKLTSIQQKHEDKRGQINEQALRRQNLLSKSNESSRAESMKASKYKKSPAVNSQMLPRAKLQPSNKRSLKATTKIPSQDPPKRTDQEDVQKTDISRQTAPRKENSEKEDRIHKSETNDPKTDVENKNRNLGPAKGKVIEVSTKQKEVIPKKIQRSEIPQKIDEMMSRRNGNLNHLTRSTKQPAKLFKDLKQQMLNKHRNVTRKEEQCQSHIEIKDEKEGIKVYSASENTNIKPQKQQDNLENQDNKGIVLNISVEDANQTDSLQNGRAVNNNCYAIAINAGKVSDYMEKVEQPPYAHKKDDQDHRQHAQSTGDYKGESIELHNLPLNEDKQNHIPDRREQLTEPEKHLKETAIKSQVFLSTAEALFKLNLPVSFLHEQDYESPENKLVLTCAQEVMKRKARRHEIANDPHKKTAMAGPKVRSFDDLIKQLSKDLDTLKSYGGNSSDERDLAARLYGILEEDIFDRVPDVNCMWDLEWGNLTALVSEKEEVVREVERYMLNGLLDEITSELYCF